MGRRRRKDEGGLVEEFLDVLVAVSREAPLIGLGLSALIFAIGAWLFWGDPKRMYGMAGVAGIFPLLVGTFGGLFSIACWVRGRVTRRDATQVTDAPAANAAVEGPAAAGPIREARDGRTFERLVAACFRAQGYLVKETGTHGHGGDRGIDLVMRRPDAAAVICVQCKDYAAWKVGAEAVRAFAGAVALRGPGHVGWIVTSGRFTADAIRDATQLEIRLIDGAAWASMTRATGPDAPEETTLPQEAAADESTGTSASNAGDVPLCPRCRAAMVRRAPKPGGKQFRPFWGCRNFPRCREVVDIA